MSVTRAIPVALAALLITSPALAQATAVADSAAPKKKPEPFAFGDFTWLNGNSRQHAPLLDTKYFTGQVIMDVNYSYSNNHPIDNTIVGSSVTGRHNEINVAFASFGGDFHYKNARATFTTQFGTRTGLVPRNDGSVLRGQYDVLGAMKYIREATAGYHFDVANGLNVDAGIFVSYIGLASYIQAENWMYQPSYVSDNTPFFFQGVRTQLFPNDRLKVELWLTNGWQTYSKFNNGVGLGYQVNWRPQEWVSLVANGYYGTDTRNTPDRKRYHSDNSLTMRYLNHPGASGVSKGAFSLTGDLGCESGGGVTCGTQYFAGFMAYHRLWFANDKLGWTVGGGAIKNPGRYLVLAPPGPVPFDQSPGTQFSAWDLSTTVDWAPDEQYMLRLELVRRHASVPYFAGPGGSTSPDGYVDTPLPPGWQPDRVQDETRLIAAMLVRF